MGFSGWVLYSGGAHDGQTLWSSVQADGVIVRRDAFSCEAYRIDVAASGADPGSTLPVAVFRGIVD